ncbi:putative fungal pheromoneG-protein-coupled receptor [Amylocystis lapponica]|nr:putative fungal pheromoneG-protein-coupled receptor [Amylocystis lapponica]
MGVAWSVQQDIVIAFSFLGFVLVSIPLYWQIEAWNVGCLLYMFWTATQCLIQFINMNIWKDNAINWAPVWCDITSRWRLASSVGVCASSLVINRRLCRITTVASMGFTREEKRRMVLLDLAIGLGLPVLQVALYWFIQGHRFDILEGFGCIHTIPNTVLSWFLFDSWPLVIGLVSMVYCTLTLRRFIRREKELKSLLTSNSNLNFNRYFRLMGLAAIEICCTIPVSIFGLVNDSQVPIYKFVGLADLHYNFSFVLQSPAVIWRSSPATVRAIDLTMWSIILCALVFFAFFGFAEDARKHYRLAFTAVAKRLGVSTAFLDGLRSRMNSRGNNSKPSTNVLANITIPSFVQRPASRRESDVSFCTRLSTSISLGNMAPCEELDDKSLPSIAESSASTSCICTPDAKGAHGALQALPVPVAPHLSFVLDMSAAMRHSPDVPSPAVRPDSLDMV